MDWPGEDSCRNMKSKRHDTLLLACEGIMAGDPCAAHHHSGGCMQPNSSLSQDGATGPKAQNCTVAQVPLAC